jgi:hypothetical protein
VLVRPEATVIDESLDIMLWAMADSDGAVPSCDTSLIAANNGTFKYHPDRYNMPTDTMLIGSNIVVPQRIYWSGSTHC